MARKPGSIRSLARGFERTLDDEEYRRSPTRYNSGNEQQSELLPSRAPAAPVSSGGARRAKPAGGGGTRKPAPVAPRAPLPPRRPSMPMPMTPSEPLSTGGIQGPPYIPGTMPGVNPLGDVTGAPLVPPGPTPQPTDMIPPLTGPNSDRMAGISPGMGPGDAWAARVNTALPPMPQGQSAAGAALQALGLTGGPSQAGAGPPVGVGPADAAGGAIPLPGGLPTGSAPSFGAMAPPTGLPPPQTGPASDRAVPPPGLLEQAGGWLKRNVPPLQF